MKSWMDRILAALETVPDREEVAMWAASLFQISRGQPPFDASVDPAEGDLDKGAIQRLADLLEREVRADPTGPETESLVWALGKCCEPGLRSLFVLVLAANLQGNPKTLHQALIALDNLHEPVLVDEGFFSALEVQRNRALASLVLGLQPEDEDRSSL